MRAFIAIKLPQEIKGFISEVQSQLKTQCLDAKWVEPQNIHLTLKFLGEIDDNKLTDITKILEDVAKDKNSFHVRIASLGAFPKINSPRVVWIGIDKGDSEAKEIAETIEEKAEKIGIPREDRPYSCHITIGRIKSSLNRDGLVQALHRLINDFGGKNQEFRVNKIILFKSTLTPKGAIYEILKEANLKTA